MPCPEDMKLLLSRYVDGELSPEERARVEEHVGGCGECRELLALFQRHENLLADALSADAFGDAVVASVMASLRKEAPPVARPVEEGLGDWLRARPVVPLAAAALFVVGLVTLLSMTHAARVEALKQSLQEQVQAAREAREETLRLARQFQEQAEMTSRLSDELAREARDRRTDEILRAAREGSVLGYVDPEGYAHRLVVKARFDGGRFSGYNVYRRNEKDRDDRFVKLNPEPLKRPEFEDRSARPGQGYVYKFEALRPDADPVESVPVFMRLPAAGDLDPERTVRIVCEELAAPKDLARFRLERTIAGRKVTHRFYAGLGQRVGDRVHVPGVGEVDFTTDFVLGRIEEGTQTLSITYTEQRFDPDGKPVFLRLGDGMFIPDTRQYEVAIGARESRRAVLRPAGSTDPRFERAVWKDGSILVPAPR
ncbi:MAG TPA: zf-HC2 domain-containing protein [Planctomycetota bacterium]|nr:zf-HC2 domain-containing protein [Planctomycetota bacterium]